MPDQPCSDNELPGMWETADFGGGLIGQSTPAPPTVDDFEVIGEIVQCIFGSSNGTPDPEYCAPLLPVGNGQAVWCQRCRKIAGMEEVADGGT